MNEEFALLLRRFRLRAGLTQERLADISGVSAHSVSMLERGRRSPRLSSVSVLATALDLTADERGRLIGSTVGPSVSEPSDVRPAWPVDVFALEQIPPRELAALLAECEGVLRAIRHAAEQQLSDYCPAAAP